MAHSCIFTVLKVSTTCRNTAPPRIELWVRYCRWYREFAVATPTIATRPKLATSGLLLDNHKEGYDVGYADEKLAW